MSKADPDLNELDVLVSDPGEVLQAFRGMLYSHKQAEIIRLFNLRKEVLTHAMYCSMAHVGTKRRQCDPDSINGKLITLLKIPVEKRGGVFLTPRGVKYE